MAYVVIICIIAFESFRRIIKKTRVRCQKKINCNYSILIKKLKWNVA